MAGPSRITQEIFSTTGLTGTGGFGAAANGTTTTEAGSNNTPDNIQTGVSGAWAGGIASAVLGASKFLAEEDLNAVLNVITYQLAYLLERGIAEYDTGTTYNIGDVAKGVGNTYLFSSLTNTNVGNALPTPPSSNSSWQYCGDLSNIGSTGIFTGGTTTGSANAQVLASLTPASGFVSGNGQTIICTAGYTNTGSTTLAITSPSVSATTIKKDSGSGLVALVAGDITVGDTLFLTYNTTGSCFVLTAGLPLGACANLNVGTGLASSGGNLNNAGFVTEHVQTFNSSGTYTPTTGMVYCVVRAVAGGGAGGAGANPCSGGGGGGGEYREAIFTAATIGASQTVTIGAAGANVTLGSLLTAVAGSTGTAGGSSPGVAGGAGGTGGSGGFGIPGAQGDAGSYGANAYYATSGKGGNSYMGFGGATVASGAGNAAPANSGGGGSGGSGYSGSPAGGAASTGRMIIIEYCNQ